MEWLIILLVLVAVITVGLWFARTFKPEIERARRIRRAERGGARPVTSAGPRALYRSAAAAEMVTWGLLILAMVLKYSGITAALTPVAGGVHGFVFLCYVAVVIAVWVDERWPAGRGLVALGSAVIPFMTVPFERHLHRHGGPSARWRVLEEPASARSAGDRLLATVLGRPVLSAFVVLGAVAVLFTALLTAGPPTQWFGA